MDQDRSETTIDDRASTGAARATDRAGGTAAGEAVSAAHGERGGKPRAPAKPMTEAGIEALARLDLAALRSLWQDRFGPPPRLRSPELLRHLLAWRLQVEAFGDLDRETRRRLAARGPLEAEGRQFGIGAILRRDWQGQRIEVVVETHGFRWEEQIFPSLSAVARAATGTRWNGPRFFGLRTEETSA